MSDIAWQTIEVVALAAISGVTSIALAYIAARWHISNRPGSAGDSSNQPDYGVKKNYYSPDG